MRAAVDGATVNDVALSIVGGALRAYLDDKGELPPATLRAVTPISVRTESERGALGNQVSAMIVSLGTDVADPVERLAAVRASSQASKELTQAVGARNLTELSQLAPGLLIGLGSRLAGQLSRRGFGGLFNTVVTNVPGPRQPLYFAGARVVRMTGAGPIVDGNGLINIVGSYLDQFVLSFTSCRTMMPDPARYADCFDESFYALRAATAATVPTTAPIVAVAWLTLTNPPGRAGSSRRGRVGAEGATKPRNLSGAWTGRVRRRWKAARPSREDRAHRR